MYTKYEQWDDFRPYCILVSLSFFGTTINIYIAIIIQQWSSLLPLHQSMLPNLIDMLSPATVIETSLDNLSGYSLSLLANLPSLYTMDYYCVYIRVIGICAACCGSYSSPS